MSRITKCLMLLLVSWAIGCGGQVRHSPLDGVPDPDPTPTPVATPTPVPPPYIARSGTVFVGDSIFGRMPLDVYFPGKGYVNAGWFGKRTDEILAVFPAILDGSNVCHGYDPTSPNLPDPEFPFVCQKIPPPATIVLLIGWNDLIQAHTTYSAANIQQMFVLAKQSGVRIIVCIPYIWDSAHLASWMTPWTPCSNSYAYSDTLNSLTQGIEQAAVAENVTDINIQWLFRTGPLVGGQCESGYTIDGLHPNDYGYWQIAAFIGTVLQ